MDEFEKILVLATEVEAELMHNLLTERGIPHILKNYHDSALDGLFQSTKGWGHLEAPVKYQAEIRAILDDIRKPSNTPSEESAEGR